MSDEQNLVRASLAGDCRAFERLVEKYQSLICAITFSATGRVDASEELAQETFLQAWKNLFQLKDIDKFRSWLCSIARNLIVTHYRQKHASKVAVCDTDTLEILAAQASPSSAEIAIGREEEMILSHALMQLPEEYREPLVLFYRQHQSTKEVAQSLDMNEATVRTRLSRGRQMLKDKVSAMVERTLEKTGPGKQFTKAVMVSIGAGLAAGTAATAAGTTAGSLATAGGATTAATGILAATGVKIAAIAAAVIIGAGAVVYHYWNPADSTEPAAQAAVIEPAQEQDLQEMASSDSPALAHAVNAVAQEAALQNKAQETPVQIPPVSVPEASSQPVIAHTDWPGIDEPLKYVHATWTTIDQDDTEASEEIWFRLSDGFRYEPCVGDIIIDDGRQRLVLDPNTRQAQLEPTWFVDGNYYLYGSPKPLRDHPAFPPIQLFRDKQPNPDIELTKIPEECNASSEVYFLKDLSLTDPNAVVTRIWVDKRTGLPEKIEGIYTGPLHQNDTRKKALITYDYSPFSDTLFSMEIPADYQTLPARPLKGFSGQVFNLLGQPVAGAEVYVHFQGLDYLTPLEGKTDQNGEFLILMRGEQVAHSTVAVWAKLPDNPDFIGWTLLLSPYEQEKLADEQKRGFPLGGTIPGSPGVVYPSEDYLYEKTENSIIYRGSWCQTASDIVLVMEPANKVFGWVQDTQGNAVTNAKLSVSLGAFSNQRGYQSEIVIGSKHPVNLFSAQTDEQGYYEVGCLPKLWKKCSLSVRVNPDSGDCLVGDSRRMDINDPNKPIQADFVLLPQGPTVRGIVADNYGTPLPGRTVSVLVDGKYFPGYGANTDKDGRFEFKHCPTDKDLEIRATLSSRIYNYNGKETGQEYYPDVTVKVGYQPGQDEYEVKLVAIKPEIEIEAVLMDTAGNPLPYFPVEIRADESLPTQWVIERGFHRRTDADGTIKFTQVPQMKALRLACSWVLEPTISDKAQTAEMQEYFKQLQQDYQQYHWTEVVVPLVPGQKKYQKTITIPTEEEYKRQKESTPVESLLHNP
ncbi:MAG TPA: sigma-70 family RNA polymerase sigma factor [Anaerohalosphaeraceae bacterium]|nr:sigma-70 family RNA polymerase sigma factor [Anaerohalosphaeraceae bacterium]